MRVTHLDKRAVPEPRSQTDHHGLVTIQLPDLAGYFNALGRASITVL
jgi:hypothetical protein